MVFVLDSSGSITAQNWQLVLNFTKDVIGNISDIGPFHTQVAVMSYATRVSNRFNLSTYSNKDDVLDAINIENFPWKDEETNTSGALWYMREKLFSLEYGAREQAPRLGIVLTDGASNRDANLTIPYANEAKAASITMISIGVGSETNQAELSAIATNASYAFQAASFEALSTINSQVSVAACDIPVGE